MPGIRRRAQVRQTILKSERYLVHYLVGRKRDQRRCPTSQYNGALVFIRRLCRPLGIDA